MSYTSYVLGLHFGLDDAVCVLHDGAINGYIIRERSNRIKHALDITVKEIELELVEAGIDQKTGVPVLMNTSFNGSGEPIVDTPAEAIAFLLGSGIDVVYVEGRRLVRA